MTDITMRLDLLRGEMMKNDIDHYMVPSSDFHDSEYVGDYFKEREYMSAKGLPIRYTELWKQIMALVREKCGGKIAADTSLPVQKILEMTGARKH